MGEGDGRNGALFRHSALLLRNGYTPTEVKRILYLINQYVFAEPLPDAEMKKLTRKEALESAGYDYAAVQAEVDRRYGVTSTTEKCDDILTVGSVVTSKPMSIKAVNGSAIKYVDGVECVNIPDLGGWFPTKYVSEYDSSDGKKDNYLANTKAKVYLDNATVEAIDIPNNLAKIHGIWCKADPMIEIKEGK